MEAARAGDEPAFGELVRAYSPILFRLVFQMVPSREDAEDILQDTFYRFFRALPRLRPNEDPLPFLRTIAVRRTYSHLASHRRSHESLEELPDNLPALAVEGIQVQVRDLYLWAERLPRARRLVFLLREVLGIEDAELARLMGISQVTVRRHAQLAIVELRRTFGER
jgi:RNA polymerase sigma-70 factor (ECF subfamily)